MRASQQPNSSVCATHRCVMIEWGTNGNKQQQKYKKQTHTRVNKQTKIRNHYEWHYFVGFV